MSLKLSKYQSCPEGTVKKSKHKKNGDYPQIVTIFHKNTRHLNNKNIKLRLIFCSVFGLQYFCSMMTVKKIEETLQLLQDLIQMSFSRPRLSRHIRFRERLPVCFCIP